MSEEYVRKARKRKWDSAGQENGGNTRKTNERNQEKAESKQVIMSPL